MIKEKQKKKTALLKPLLTIELDEKRESHIVELLNESENYLEKNLNAAANNMSMLAMHTFEFASHLEQQKRD